MSPIVLFELEPDMMHWSVENIGLVEPSEVGPAGELIFKMSASLATSTKPVEAKPPERGITTNLPERSLLPKCLTHSKPDSLAQLFSGAKGPHDAADAMVGQAKQFKEQADAADGLINFVGMHLFARCDTIKGP